MTAPTSWGDVEAGQRVTLNGREWLVKKTKRDGKKVRVKVVGTTGTFSSAVKASDTVELVPLRGSHSKQKRWATIAETNADVAVKTILDGKPVGVSETIAGVEYVPTVDPSTIAAHLWIYHDVQAADFDDFEAMARIHDDQHEREIAKVPHTHSRRRP